MRIDNKFSAKFPPILIALATLWSISVIAWKRNKAAHNQMQIVNSSEPALNGSLWSYFMAHSSINISTHKAYITVVYRSFNHPYYVEYIQIISMAQP